MVIPSSINEIEDQAFYGCSGLADDLGMVIINDILCYYCGTDETVVVPDNVRAISGHAFCECEKISSVIIPKTVTYIGTSAFRLCKRLTSVTIPNSVTSIDNDAFELCNMDNLMLKVHKGSYAMKYAKRKGINIEIIE